MSELPPRLDSLERALRERILVLDGAMAIQLSRSNAPSNGLLAAPSCESEALAWHSRASPRASERMDAAREGRRRSRKSAEKAPARSVSISAAQANVPSARAAVCWANVWWRSAPARIDRGAYRPRPPRPRAPCRLARLPEGGAPSRRRLFRRWRRGRGRPDRQSHLRPGPRRQSPKAPPRCGRARVRSASRRRRPRRRAGRLPARSPVSPRPRARAPP